MEAIIHARSYSDLCDSFLEFAKTAQLPHIVDVRGMSPFDWVEVDEWCVENFGPNATISKSLVGQTYTHRLRAEGRWDSIGYRFLFRDLADAALFKLRWE